MKTLAGRTAVKGDPVTADPSSVLLVFRTPRLRCLLSVPSDKKKKQVILILVYAQ